MLRESARYLLRNRLILFLTSFGIAVSITCLLSVHYLTVSVRDSLNRELNHLGKDLTVLNIARPDGLPESFISDLLKTRIADYVCPHKTVVTEKDGELLTLYLTDNTFFERDSVRFFSGHGLSAEDNAANVCVLGYGLYEGQSVFRAGAAEYEVAGVLEEGSYDLYGNYDQTVFLPLGNRLPDSYLIRTCGDGAGDLLKEYLSLYLSDREYEIIRNENFSDSMDSVTGFIGQVMEWIAGISLFVSVSGLSSVNILTGSRRSREWGIRKASGAGAREIMLQVLTESVMISVLGFAEGLACSAVFTGVLSNILDLPWLFEIPEICKTAAWTVGLGMGAGILPAWQAAGKTAAECMEA